MFETVIEASKRALSDESDVLPAAEDVRFLSGILRESESAEHALVSTEPIEWTADGETETIEPAALCAEAHPYGDADGHAFLLVTDRRLYIVADESSEPAVSFPLESVAAVGATDSLMRRSLDIQTDTNEQVTLTPAGGDIETVATFIRHTAESWQGMNRALDEAWETLEAYRDPQSDLDSAPKAAQKIQMRLKAANEAVTRYVDTPARLLDTELAPAANELVEELRTETERLEAHAEANDDDVETYNEAKGVLQRARNIAVKHTDGDTDSLDAALERLETAIERGKFQWGGT